MRDLENEFLPGAGEVSLTSVGVSDGREGIFMPFALSLLEGLVVICRFL